jgi:dihydrodipicolinate synthase/N-acetylneuraminate lyase
MDKSKSAATYKRSVKTRGKNVPYEQKFSNLIQLCEKAKAEGIRNVIVTWPWVIGDTYDEVIESLSRFADAGLELHIVERCMDDDPPLSRVSLN